MASAWGGGSAPALQRVSEDCPSPREELRLPDLSAVPPARAFQNDGRWTATSRTPAAGGVWYVMGRLAPRLATPQQPEPEGRTGSDQSWASLIGAHGDETTDYIQVQAGNTSDSNGSNSDIRKVTIESPAPTHLRQLRLARSRNRPAVTTKPPAPTRPGGFLVPAYLSRRIPRSRSRGHTGHRLHTQRRVAPRPRGTDGFRRAGGAATNA